MSQSEVKSTYVPTDRTHRPIRLWTDLTDAAKQTTIIGRVNPYTNRSNPVDALPPKVNVPYLGNSRAH